MPIREVYLASALGSGVARIRIDDHDEFPHTDEAYPEPPGAMHRDGHFHQQLRLSLPRIDLLSNLGGGELQWSAVSWRLEEFRGCQGNRSGTRMLPTVCIIDEAKQATPFFVTLAAVCKENMPDFQAPYYVVEDLALTVMEPIAKLAAALPLRFLVAPSNAVPGGNVPSDKAIPASPRSTDPLDRARAKWNCDAYQAAVSKLRGAAMAAAPATVFTVLHPYSIDELNKFQRLGAALEKESAGDTAVSRTARRTLVFVHMYTKAQLESGSVDRAVRRLAHQLGATHKKPSRCVYWVSGDGLTEIRHQWCPSYDVREWTANQRVDVLNLRATLTQAIATDANELVKTVLEELRKSINAPELVLQPHPASPPRIASTNPTDEEPVAPAMYLLRPCEKTSAAGDFADLPSYGPIESVGMVRQSTHADIENEGGWLEVAERRIPGTNRKQLVVGVKFPSADPDFVEDFKRDIVAKRAVKIDEVSDTNQSLKVIVHLHGAVRLNLDGSKSAPITETCFQRLPERYVRGSSDEGFTNVQYIGGVFEFVVEELEISCEVDRT